MTRPRGHAVARLLALLLAAGCASSGPREPASRPVEDPTASDSITWPVSRLAFLGEATIASDLEFEGTPVGGLSAITYDRASDLFYAIADDPSYFDETRFYGLSIDLADGALEDGDVEITSVTRLKDRQGRAFATYVLDGEGLVVDSSGGFYLSSEGHVERGIEPRLSQISAAGSTLRQFEIPRRYLPGRNGRRGVRHNLAFESLTTTPDGRWLFSGIENALVQDGAESELDHPSPARILRFDARSGRLAAEFLYWVEPVPRPPAENDGFRVNGLVELLALDDTHLLALERAFAAGTGNTIRIFHVDLSAAENVGRRALATRASGVSAAKKTLLLDLADLGIELDNLEGLTFGPDLPSGDKTLVLIADNNFSSHQRNQILAFSWSNLPVTASEIQGSAHRSPLAGAWVWGVEGVITAVDRESRQPMAWIQSAADDGNPATSEGLAFSIGEATDVSAGDRVRLSGRVVEEGRSGSLSVTRLARASAHPVSTAANLPAAVVLGPDLPSEIDNDGLTAFEPKDDALDLLESLEGMRVELPEPTVVGPTSRFGDFVVVAEGGGDLAFRTRRGGVLLRPDGAFSGQIQVDPRLVAERSASSGDLAVGVRLEGSIVGVLDYSFGAYEIVVTEPLPAAEARPGSPERTALAAGPKQLTVATFNVENLDALDPDEKYEAVARTIVQGLASPDILALQEVQDDNGAIDDGGVSAAATLGKLVLAIADSGGPRYEAYQIDPENNADGGQPGANIRVAYLVQPQRLQVARRRTGTARTSAHVESVGEGRIGLSHNPGRLAADHPAFVLDEELGNQPTRKPLVLEVEFEGRQLFLVNLHLKSKRGDDSSFGPVQPPQRHSERQRAEQAHAIREFVSTILAADEDAAIVVLGDLNEHEFRPPLAALAGRSLVNLIPRVDAAERYTYNYRGNSQVLDHVLVSRSLAENAAPEIDIVHVNADLPATLRASDHDPVVVRLDLADF